MATQPDDRKQSQGDGKADAASGSAGADASPPKEGAKQPYNSTPKAPSAEQQIQAQLESAIIAAKAGADVVATAAMRKFHELKARMVIGGLQRSQASSPASKGLQKLYEASRMLNELTGYSEVEALKTEVTTADRELTTAKHTAAHCKQVYEGSVERQIQLQRDLNKLLERKGSWSDDDVQRFAALCRDEGKISHEVKSAHDGHEEAVRTVDHAQERFMSAMRERYTAEQLWGDKIRRAATWYTWGLMGLQLVSFVAVILVVEPRRVRLLQERVKELLDAEHGSTAQQVDERLRAHMSELQHSMAAHREDLIMQTLSAGGAGTGAAQQQHEPQLPQVETAKMMVAVASFMDGVHTELVQQRQLLARLEAKLSAPTADSASTTTGEEGEGVQGAGQHVAAEAGTLEWHVPPGSMEAIALQAVQERQRGGWVVGGHRLSREQVLSATAAVSAGVGAVVGAVLVAYFSGSR